jgi:hypothetical protein
VVQDERAEGDGMKQAYRRRIRPTWKNTWALALLALALLVAAALVKGG